MGVTVVKTSKKGEFLSNGLHTHTHTPDAVATEHGSSLQRIFLNLTVEVLERCAQPGTRLQACLHRNTCVQDPQIRQHLGKHLPDLWNTHTHRPCLRLIKFCFLYLYWSDRQFCFLDLYWSDRQFSAGSLSPTHAQYTPEALSAA